MFMQVTFNDVFIYLITQIVLQLDYFECTFDLVTVQILCLETDLLHVNNYL